MCVLAMECSGCRAHQVSGGVSGGEPPVPIPNTEVKPASADGTWGVGPWESRTPPDVFKLRGRTMRPLERVVGSIGIEGLAIPGHLRSR